VSADHLELSEPMPGGYLGAVDRRDPVDMLADGGL
jgi:hypothetical protein